MEASCKRHTKEDGSWWEGDAKGIPMFRCCDKCRVEQLRKRNPNYLTEGQCEDAGMAAPSQSYEDEAADWGERIEEDY
jgi:hypothetical protein